MFMTSNAIKNTGAFNEKFTVYGFEHADYSNRIYGERNNYLMLKGTDEYIYSEDYCTPAFKSSISNDEKKNHIKENWDKYFKEPQQTYLPL